MSGVEALAFVGIIQLGCQSLLSGYKTYREFPGDIHDARDRVGVLSRAIAGFRELDIDWSSSNAPSDLVEFNLAVSELEALLEKYAPLGSTSKLGFLNGLRYLLFAKAKFIKALEKVNKIQFSVDTAARIHEL